MSDSSGSDRFYQWNPFPYEGYWFLEPVKGTEAYRLQCVLSSGERFAHELPVLDLAVVEPGEPMDFSRTALGMTVVSSRAADLLRRVAANDVELFPCRIDGLDRGFQVVNIVTPLDCVDRARSKLLVPGDPDGTTTDMFAWVIDPVRTAGHALFRLDNEEATIVVSEVLKEEIMRQRLVGPGLIELDGEGLNNLMPGYEPKPTKKPSRQTRRHT